MLTELEPQRAVRRSHATIMLVDSVPTSLRDSKAALEAAGHRVLATEFGASAILLGEDNRGLIDVLVAEATLTLVSGLEVIEYLRSRDRKIATVLVVAAGRDLTADAAAVGAAVLQRPFRVDQLLRVVQEALSCRSSKTASRT